MNRRGFLKGTVSVMAIAAVIKFAPKPTVKVEKFLSPTGFTITDEEMAENQYEEDIAANYSRALARSMMQTKEVVGAKVLSGTFG